MISVNELAMTRAHFYGFIPKEKAHGQVGHDLLRGLLIEPTSQQIVKLSTFTKIHYGLKMKTS